MKAEINLSIIKCYKMASDVNNVEALTAFPEDIYGNMKCEELWKN